MISVHSMLSMGSDIADEMVSVLGKNQDLVYNISVITRLCNDLGTSVVIVYSFRKKKKRKLI